LHDDIKRAINDPLVSGVVTDHHVGTVFLDGIHVEPSGLVVFIDVDENEDIEPITKHIRSLFSADISLFMSVLKDRRVVGASFKPEVFPKRDLVYLYPDSKLDHHLDLLHPWCDPGVSARYQVKFVTEVSKIIRKHGMTKFLRRETVFDEDINLATYGGYVLKKTEKDKANIFPLSLNIPSDDDYYIGVAIETAVPIEEVDRAIGMITEINDLVYEMDGKTYLYGTHKLTLDQIEKHFGKEVIKKWNKIKDELDPKHLLNIGVIEHLD